MKLRTIAAIATVVSLSACAGAGPQAEGVFETRAGYDRLFAAAQAAAPRVGYHVVGADKANGLITAEQNVIMGRGTAVGMSANITSHGGIRSLHVSFIAPPGTFAFGGDFQQNVDEYVGAVRGMVPDLRASR